MLRLAPSHVRFVASLAPVLAALSLAPAAQAIDKKAEAEAKKTASDAMDTDYLANDLKKAKAKLEKAIQRCGKDKCTPATLATLHRDLGVVLATSKDAKGAAKELDAALSADPKGEVPKDYLSYADVKKAWEAAKQRAKGSASGPSESAGDAGGVSVRFATAPVGYEFPIVVTAPKGAAAVKVSFKTDAMDKYHALDAEKQGKVWVAIIPCAHTGAEGEIKYFVKALDGSGEELDHKGSVKSPETITVVKTMPDGEETPSLPGDKEPKQCGDQGDKKGDGDACDSDDQCQDGLACKDGDDGKHCASGERKSSKSKSSGGGPRFFIGVEGQLEMLSLGSTGNLCNQSGWACSSTEIAGQPGRFDVGPGDPTKVVNVTSGGRTDGGTAWGTGRVMVTADYLVSSHFALGARIGYAFNGNPTNEVHPFNPLHVELRAHYFFTESSIRPFFSFGVGYGEMDGKVNGVVVQPVDPSLAAYQDSNGNAVIPNVSGWRTTGPLFASAGGGAWVFLSDNFALDVGINVILPLQNFSVGIAPELGLKYGF